MNCNSNVVVPELLQDECKGCRTLDECVTITADLSELDIFTESNLKAVVEVLIEKILDLQNQINIINLNNG